MKYNVVIPAICLLVNVVCSCDWKAEIAIVKNQTTDTLLVAMPDEEAFTDSVLYNERFADYLIPPKQTKVISVSDVKPKKASDLEKVQLYFIKYNTVIKLQKLKRSKNIVKKSLLLKKTIQLNKISYPLDTFFVRAK